MQVNISNGFFFFFFVKVLKIFRLPNFGIRSNIGLTPSPDQMQGHKCQRQHGSSYSQIPTHWSDSSFEILHIHNFSRVWSSSIHGRAGETWIQSLKHGPFMIYRKNEWSISSVSRGTSRTWWLITKIRNVYSSWFQSKPLQFDLKVRRISTPLLKKAGCKLHNNFIRAKTNSNEKEDTFHNIINAIMFVFFWFCNCLLLSRSSLVHA